MKLKNENSTKIIERLSQFIEFKHDNFNRLSQNIGVSNSYFSKMVRNNGSIGSELLSKIVIYYDDLDINWLITGEGDMLKSSSKISPSGAPVPAPEQSDQSPGTECQLCKEKDERIKDLQKMVKFQSDTISSILQQIEPIHKQDSDLDDTIGTKTG